VLISLWKSQLLLLQKWWDYHHAYLINTKVALGEYFCISIMHMVGLDTHGDTKTFSSRFDSHMVTPNKYSSILDLIGTLFG
jgi:hypothetical protein